MLVDSSFLTHGCLVNQLCVFTLVNKARFALSFVILQSFCINVSGWQVFITFPGYYIKETIAWRGLSFILASWIYASVSTYCVSVFVFEIF